VGTAVEAVKKVGIQQHSERPSASPGKQRHPGRARQVSCTLTWRRERYDMSGRRGVSDMSLTSAASKPLRVGPIVR
jgi:hypothetical protein